MGGHFANSQWNIWFVPLHGSFEEWSEYNYNNITLSCKYPLQLLYMDNSQYNNISTLNRLYPLLLFILGLPSATVYTWSTLCYCVYPLLLFIHTGLASATGSTIAGYTLSTKDLTAPVMYSLRLCKVLALMHYRMYIVNLVTHSSIAKMYVTMDATLSMA